MNDDTPVTPNSGKPPRLIETVFPTKATTVFYTVTGIGVGFVLASFAVHAMLPKAEVNANLLLCVGFAVFFAAIGSQATVRIGGIVVAGSAATAIALFFVLEDRIDKQRKQKIDEITKSYVRGKISKVPGREVTGGRMERGIDFFGNMVPEDKLFQFALFGGPPEHERANFYLDDASEDGMIFLIHRSCLAGNDGKARVIEWELRQAPVVDGEENVMVPAIYDAHEGAIIAVHNDTSQTRKCTKRKGAGLGWSAPVSLAGFLSIAPAFAATERIDPPDEAQLRQALADLSADKVHIRRNARSTLSLAPVDFVPEILNRMKSADRAGGEDRYRVVLGGNVALTLMLRRDKKLAGDISRKLSEEDLRLIIKDAGHKNRTMRVYPTEFLYDLSDPRVTMLALPLAAATRNDTARYNWVFVSQGGWDRLGEEDRKRLEPDIERLETTSGENTKKLLAAYK